jgi:hypothetical protein
MIDRFLLWLGAGVITACLSAAMITGAGVAAAEAEGPSDPVGRQQRLSQRIRLTPKRTRTMTNIAEAGG